MDRSDSTYTLLPRFTWFVLHLDSQLSLTGVLLKGNRSPIADPRMRGSIVGLTLVSSSPLTDSLFIPECSRVRVLIGFVAARSRAQIRTGPRGHRASDPTHRRQAKRRGTLHPRALPLGLASPERAAHAPLGQRVQHARRAPSLARSVGRPRRRDVGPLRDDARSGRSGERALGYHAGDDAACDCYAARCWGEGEEIAGREVSDFLGVD